MNDGGQGTFPPPSFDAVSLAADIAGPAPSFQPHPPMDPDFRLLPALGVDPSDRRAVSALARAAALPARRLRQLDAEGVLPAGAELERLCAAADTTPEILMLRMGRPDRRLLHTLARHAEAVLGVLPPLPPPPAPSALPDPVLTTAYGRLYQGDCLDVMQALPAESVDVIFADPPFNLNKAYPSAIDDDRGEAAYLDWTEAWLTACIRLLKPGGSLFHWNLPRWNAAVGAFLEGRLTFRHWIAVDVKYRLPIAGRLYPAHYALTYYCKGPRPRVFHPDRLPMEVCPHCVGDLKDYGGYKHKMNPAGVSLTDVWRDVPPVRHARYKRRNGANELSLRLLDRVIELASDPGDLVFDPFGGAGTTYVAAELKGRRWLGVEIGPYEDILRRFEDLSGEQAYLARQRAGYNALFPPDTRRAREARGLWTDETVRRP